MYLRMAKRLLTETDKRLVWKLVLMPFVQVNDRH